MRRFVTLRVATGGVGKTALVIAEAVGFCAGRDPLSLGVGSRGRVWYIGLEDPREEYDRRIAAAVLHHQIPHAKVTGALFVDTAREQNFVIAREARSGVQIAEPIVASIIDNVWSHRIDQVIVDPFIGCHEIPESDNGRIASVVAAWAMIAERTNCSVELVHHVRKSGTGNGDLTADDARGASALVNGARSVRILHPMTQDEAERAGIAERRRFFRMSMGKANLALASEAAVWRELVSVDLRNGGDGHGDLVGVAAPWSWPNPFDDVTVDHLREVQRRLSQGSYRADVRASDWAGIMVADVLGWDASERSSRNDLRSILSKWRTTGAIRAVTRADGRRKPREFLEKGEPA